MFGNKDNRRADKFSATKKHKGLTKKYRDKSGETLDQASVPDEIYLDTFDADLIRQTLDQWGVAVVRSHFTSAEADAWLQEIKDWLISIGDGLTHDPSTWTTYYLPYGPRLGMMQSLISHCPTVWKIREAFYPLFCNLHQETQLYTSIDGATVHPYIPDEGKDWPHIDQTIVDVDCIQGQVVLTDTTASFRCTPESHKQHEEILDMFGKRDEPSNWLKFDVDQITALKDRFNFKYWQVPIHAPKGSIIFWKSNTIHSAKKNDLHDETWRGVVYVSMRKASEYSSADAEVLKRAAIEGRTTNHWGTFIFPKKPRYCFSAQSPALAELTQNPELVVTPLSPLLMKLTAQMPYD
jgi:hypothetical protein